MEAFCLGQTAGSPGGRRLFAGDPEVARTHTHAHKHTESELAWELRSHLKVLRSGLGFVKVDGTEGFRRRKGLGPQE